MGWFSQFHNQFRGAAYRAVSRTENTVRRETNLTGHASRLAGEGLRKGEEKVRERLNRPGDFRSGGRAVSQPISAPRTADGYERKSPVQPICETPGYRRRLLFRAIGIGVAAVLLLFLINFLLGSGLVTR